MGSKNHMRILLVAAGALIAGAAAAQISIDIDDVREIFDTLELELEVKDDDVKVIDFENVRGRQFAGGVILNNQYARTHGVMFGPGVTVHRCASQFRTTSEVATTSAVRLDDRPCIYPKAASGEHVGYYDIRRAGGEMSVAFPEPVQALAVKINPTGGEPGEEFIASIQGFRDAKSEKPDMQSSMRFVWDQGAISWPNHAALETDGDRIERVTISLRRASGNNEPVRFLFDDLAVVAAPEEAPAFPVIADIAEQDEPPRVSGVRVPPPEEAKDRLRVYPPAQKIRLTIDWPAAEAAVAAQNDRGLNGAAVTGQNAVDAAELPVLLPSSTDGAAPAYVGGNRDVYNATFKRNGRVYEIYGSRLATVTAPAEDAPGIASPIIYFGSEDSITASFSVYGATYALSQYCIGDPDTDPGCFDRDALGIVAAELVVVIGQAGEARP